ncbi:Site-specific recombinase [Vibrio nigripulchritudo SO65]|uniref:recombinase family protein n=1 Tax=Vibrio nigripulchritudo TaxID=28173 RepID=UPI0003B19F84|nr:recombinase family protein [Vibrio nigripulchritudo]CCN33415.1 Site-specific recombinase [Vibrio nigripulchritudo AM115]CCN42955.1 Site-specific recombinase [Vibrio nigripulchritudo FTn2]CCN65403.1 Site-specific recombinase [Vibrio nigripulchritudo POn4]CCN79468.1 Site-specific recombinase [Vibrio nigripulchritudo SO65]
MTTAFSYIRFSSSTQSHGDSLRRQTQLAKNYCNKHSLTLSEQSFQDLGVSAFRSANTNEDNGLGQFLKALEIGAIPRGSYLLVESLDRLSRAKVQTALRQLLNITEYGITVVTLIDKLAYNSDSDAKDLIISLTVMERAHNESKTKSERLKAVWANKRANPHTTNKSSLAPFWLSLNSDKRTYSVIEKQAEIVKRIYQLSIDGHGVIAIARILNDEGIPAPKGGSWANTSVGRILKTKAVLGHYMPHISRNSTNALIEDYYPAIISEQVYYLSQHRKSERSNPNSAGRKTTFPNVFNQVAKCSKCGSPMYYDNKSPTLKYLTCREFKKKTCTNKPIRIELMHQFIIEQFLHPQHFEQFNKLVSANDIGNTDIVVLEGNLESAKEAYKQLLSISSDFSDPVIQDEIKTRHETIQSLEKQLEEAKSVSVGKISSTRLNFWEACQLTANALNKEVYKKTPEELSPEESYSAREKLNRALKDTFGEVIITHCPDTKKASITANGFTFEAHKSAMKTGFYDVIWWAA